jgi:hypothetical protein
MLGMSRAWETAFRSVNQQRRVHQIAIKTNKHDPASRLPGNYLPGTLAKTLLHIFKSYSLKYNETTNKLSKTEYNPVSSIGNKTNELEYICMMEY